MKSLCHKCAAMCCRYIALPFDTPTTQESFDEARWFLMHEGVTIFVSKGQWYLSVMTRCKHLGPDGLCQSYSSRPTICREYSDGNCDYQGGDYEYTMFFAHADQLAQYAQKALAKKAKGQKGSRPAGHKKVSARPERRSKGK